MSTKANISRERTEGYAKWLAWGYDTIQECFGTKFPDGFEDRLIEAQNLAIESNCGYSFNFGGELFQMNPCGSKGNRWMFEDDDIQFHVRTAKAGWNLSVRYLAAGLWEHGSDRLRERVLDLISSEGLKPYNEHGSDEDWTRLTRVDFAIDLHSPEFSKEQKPGLVAENLLLTSGVTAAIYFNSRRNETITIGQKSTRLQIQIYDKGKEIIDKPGKEWMYDIWAMGGYDTPIDENGNKRARDIWRFEIRFGKEFLRDRNIITFEQFSEKCNILSQEAIDRRRMIAPTLNGEYVGLNYKHRERLDLHPLWAEVDGLLSTEQKEFVPRGRMITMRRESYIDMLKKQQAGLGRSLSVAQYGAYDEETAREEALDAVDMAISDKEHHKKVERCFEKQRFMDEAH